MESAQPVVFLIAAALATIAIAAMWLPGPIRVMLIAQVAHWALSYLFRPELLLIVQPQPGFGDNIPDPRLYALGYDPGIAAVLQPIVFGLWFYAALVVAFVIWTRVTARPDAPSPTAYFAEDPVFMRMLWVLYGAGMLARLTAVATGNTSRAGEVAAPNPIINLLTVLGTVGALGLIVYARPVRTRTTLLLISGLMFGELVWTALVQSKTPIMGAALAVAVRCAMLGWTRATVIAVLVLTVTAVAGFGLLQGLKSTPDMKSGAAVVDAQYPPSARPFLSMSRRFDGLEAATDAYYAGPNSWLSPAQVGEHLVEVLIPTQLLGAEKFQSGTAWASEVRGRSVDMDGVEVSLAEGNINEGYVLGGYTGVMLDVTLTFALAVLWSRSMYSRRLPLAVTALALIEDPVLFERGAMGTAETLGKSLQTLVLIAIFYLATEEILRRQRAGTPALPIAVERTEMRVGQ
ncbi:hypothetical protein [Nocardia stercoris]|uniref:O-antigen polysaccharide polymerase Wzy n=1 Tax=Nocardia stercoris TaxID=2483361 RepID=A0A3M2LBX9_9NOCA|nr:hypothetical protein [Nocardia stercoris]RMI32188.1 hypothetical protein EBN03_14380 [Nocardia stercoris]